MSDELARMADDGCPHANEPEVAPDFVVKVVELADTFEAMTECHELGFYSLTDEPECGSGCHPNDEELNLGGSD